MSGGARRPRPRAGHRPVAAALTVAMVVAVALAGVAALRSAREGREVGPGQTDPGPPGLALAGQTAWARIGGTFDLELDVGGAPPGAQLVVQAHPAVAGPEAFERSVDGEELGPALAPAPAPLALADLPRTAAGTVVASFPVGLGPPAPDDPAGTRRISLPSPAGAVHPVRVALVGPDGATLADLVTHLVLLPPADGAGPPLAVALVAPIGVGVAFAPDGSPALDEVALGDLARAAATVAGAPSVPLALALPPATVDALERHGGDRAAEALDRLRAAAAPPARQVLRAPYTPVELGSWAAGPVRAEQLEAQLRAGDEVLSSALGRAPDGSSWVLDPSVDPTALAWLGAHGVQRVVVPEAQLDPGDGDPADLGHRPFTLVADPAGPVPAALAGAAGATELARTGDPVLDGHLFLAGLAVRHLDQPRPRAGVVVQLPPLAAAGAPVEAVGVVLDALARPLGAPPSGAAAGADGAEPAPVSPVVEAVALDRLFAEVEASDLEAGLRWDPPRPLGEVPAELAARRAQAASFATMAGADRAAPVERLLLMAATTGLDEAGRWAYLDGGSDLLGSQIAGVVLPDQQSVTLTAAAGQLPTTIENLLPYPVQVVVEWRSAKLEFPEGSTAEVTLPPGSATAVEVEVEALVSGAFPLDVTVRSPDGHLQVATSRTTVRSTAVPGLGLALAVGAGLFLLAWWARHFRTARRHRRLVATANHPAARPQRGEGR